MSEALYLYGFVPPDAEAPAEGLEGVHDRAVELLELGAAARAVVSRVPADVYAGEALERRVEDLEWLAEQGLAHERVVAWFVDRGAIVPVRLLTLYSGPAALREEVAARRAEIEAQLERFRGLREWDLKVGYTREKLMDRLADLSAEIRALDQEIAAAAPGRRYLLEKKRQDLARVEAARGARRAARELLDRVRPLASETRVLERPAADDASVVLNAALLVERGEEARVREVVAERAAQLDEIGIGVSFSGPWAPYRFLGPEPPPDAALEAEQEP